MARPTKLNEELIQQFVEELSEGMSIIHACDLLMVTQPSFHNWMRQGEEDINNENYDSIYASFFLQIKKAHAMYIKKSCKLINEGRQNWQSIAWWLERTDQSFMPKQQIQADEDGKVQVIIGGKEKISKK